MIMDASIYRLALGIASTRQTVDRAQPAGHLAASARPSAMAADQGPAVLVGRPIAAVLFDLDGTLVETDDLAAQRLVRRLAPFQRLLPGRDPAPTARRLVMTASDLFNGWLAALDRLGLDAPFQRLTRRSGVIGDNTDGHRLVPVAGTLELLSRLQGRLAVGIVSTRRSDEVHVYLQQHGLSGQVQVVVGSDTTERIKPDPQPLLWAAQQLGVSPAQTLMVGDTRADVLAAKAAGMLAVAVLCGFGERQDFAEADLILDSTAELAQWL